jgi:hypothetical protein
MATRTTWISKGDRWVFEEGEYAKFTPKDGGPEQRADFRVIAIHGPTLVETDLKGLSRYDWEGPILSFAGTAEEFVEE